MNVYVVQRHFEDSEGFAIEGVYASREGAGIALSLRHEPFITRTVEEYEVGVWHGEAPSKEEK